MGWCKCLVGSRMHNIEADVCEAVGPNVFVIGKVRPYMAGPILTRAHGEVFSTPVAGGAPTVLASFNGSVKLGPSN